MFFSTLRVNQEMMRTPDARSSPHCGPFVIVWPVVAGALTATAAVRNALSINLRFTRVNIECAGEMP
jgi:hypothetical protein